MTMPPAMSSAAARPVKDTRTPALRFMILISSVHEIRGAVVNPSDEGIGDTFVSIPVGVLDTDLMSWRSREQSDGARGAKPSGSASSAMLCEHAQRSRPAPKGHHDSSTQADVPRRVRGARHATHLRVPSGNHHWRVSRGRDSPAHWCDVTDPSDSSSEELTRLTAANRALTLEVAERRRAEAELREGQREFRLTIDTIPALVWAARPDGTAEFFNRHYLEFIGLSAEQAAGWGWTAAVHPADVDHLAAGWRRIMASEDSGAVEARLRRFDGAYRWFLFRANPLRDDSGAIVKWYGTNFDIEDRKRAEGAIETRERELRQMTETIPEMLWSATPDGAIDYCNLRFLEYTGISAQDVTGAGWQKTIHPEDAARAAPIWSACIAAGITYRVEVRTRRITDHAYRWCVVTAFPLRDEHGRILKWHGSVIDVHDWKQAQEELRRSEALLADAQRISATGSFSWRVDTDDVTFSDELYRIFELGADSAISLERIRARVHPDDGPLLSQLIAKARE